MKDKLTALNECLKDWQQRKAGANGETDQTIAEWQVKGIQGAIDCEEALRAGTITLSQMYANADDVIDDLRLELLR